MADKIEKLKPGSGLRDPRPVLEDLVANLPGFERVLREQVREAGASLPRSGSADVQVAGGSHHASDGWLAAKAILAGERKYTAIPVPILAIYALPHDFGADNPRREEAEAWDVASRSGPQAKAFELGVRSARVVRLPRASHYVFQSNEADVLREMKTFIDALP
jgi:hypothetical protein